jgi:AcrR family transcriptional regulator
LATVDGLTGLTLGRLADDLGVAKSSVQAAFGTKEELQLAAIAAASDTFVVSVVAPAMAAAGGRDRVWELVERFLAYVDARVFPGGCFMAATFAECDSRPGPVRDALCEVRLQWLGLLEREIRKGQRAGQLPRSPSPADVAFEIDAVLAAANTARNLLDDDAPLESARRVLRSRLLAG